DHGPPGRREAVESVADQVLQDSPQHEGIRADGRQRVRQHALELTPTRVADATDRLADGCVDVARLAGRLRVEAGVVRGEVFEVRDAGLDRPLTGPERPREPSGPAARGLERVEGQATGGGPAACCG